MSRHLILIGGTAGTGKTTLARTLAHEHGAGWLQLDTVWLALRAAAEPGSSTFDLLDVPGRMRRGDSDEEVLAAHLAASQQVGAVLPVVLAFELETHPVLVADGAWLLPSFVAGLQLPDTDVRCVFLRHAAVEGVTTALAPRLEGHPPEQRHLRADRQIWQYGAWLCQEAGSRDLPVLDSTPFATLLDRVRTALGIEPPGIVAPDDGGGARRQPRT